MSDKEQRLLTPLQRKVVAAAIAYSAALLILALTFALFTLFLNFLSFFSSVIWPLAIAGILSLMLRPVVAFFEKRLKLTRLKAIALLLALVVVVCVGMVSMIIPIMFAQTLKLVEILPDVITNVRTALETRMDMHQIREMLSDEAVKKYIDSVLEGIKQMTFTAAPAIQSAGKWLAGLFAWAAAAAIIPVYMFFFLSSDHDPIKAMEEHLSFLNKGIRDDILFLVKEFAMIMVAFFRGQFMVGLLTGLVLATGFTLVGLQYGLLLGLMLGLLNIIPYLGTILGLGTVLPIAYFQTDGGTGLTALCLGVFVIAQCLESYVITPKIMGKETGLHPLTIIIAIFFWGVALNGLLGMILAVPLTAFGIIAWRLLRHKYLNRLREVKVEAEA